MKHYYFTSNGDIRVHAKLVGAIKNKDGSVTPPQFSLLGVECGDASGRYAFPAYWWNDAKACGGYFHLNSEESLLEDLFPHDQQATQQFFTEMVLGKEHYPPFPIRLPDFGRTGQECLMTWEEVQRYEYRTGTKTVWVDGKTTDEKMRSE